MGDPERLARKSLEEVAGDRLLGSEADRVDEAIEGRPACAQGFEHCCDLAVVGDVAVEHQRRPELGGELADAILEALALIAERELGALAAERARDAVGDRPVGEDARNEQALAGEKAHGRGSVQKSANHSGTHAASPRGP